MLIGTNYDIVHCIVSEFDHKDSYVGRKGNGYGVTAGSQNTKDREIMKIC